MRLNHDILFSRGYIPTHVVGYDTIFEKWGFQLWVHGNFIACEAVCPNGRKNIRIESELIAIESELLIDKTPHITDLSVDDILSMFPDGYRYIKDESEVATISATNLSYSRERGRFKITLNDEVLILGYNDEDELYFLSRSLLFILDRENLMPKNKI